jgi:ketosteroid isomerase-like protein
MSQENVEIVRRAVEAFTRQDFDALASLCHEDFEFVSVLTAVDAGEATYRGRDTWREYSERMSETWDDWRVEDLRVFDGGDDRIAAIFRLRGTGKQSGVPVDREVGAAYRIRDEKLWRMRSYSTAREALKAAGLSE